MSILKEYRLILPLKENSYRKEFDDLLYRNDIKCTNIIEVNNTSQMYKYVDSGLGLGYLITDLIEDSEKYNNLKLKDVKLPYNLDIMYIEGYVTIMAKKMMEMLLEMIEDEKNSK